MKAEELTALLRRLPPAPRTCLETVWRLQGEMHECLEAGEWAAAGEIERSRAHALEGAYRDANGLEPDEAEALAALTQALLDSDREVVGQVMAAREELARELGSLRRNQRAVSAYTRHEGA